VSGPTSTDQVPDGSGAAESLTPGLLGSIGSGPFVASETAAGLTDLTSYTATLTKSFKGTVDGAAQQWSTALKLSVGSGGMHLSVTTDGTGALEAPGELYEVGDVVYQVAPGSACTAGMAEAPGAVRACPPPPPTPRRKRISARSCS